MNLSSRVYACLAIVLAVISVPALAAQSMATTAANPAATTVILQTSVGDIHIALDFEHAPLTAKNFLAYVDSGLFSRMTFYRAMKTTRDGSEGMVQGGMRNNLRGTLPPVPLEPTYTTGLSHVNGAVSMAYTSIPGSARTEFFIIIGSIPSYDGVPGGQPGYAVFGKVTQGMSVVRKILRLPTSADARNPSMQGQMLVDQVAIVSARRAP
jgi:peptidyl-prolyl cis-trans isomerase A (cyclophilin A)